MPGRRFTGWVVAAILVAAWPTQAATASHPSARLDPGECAALGEAAGFAVFSDGDFTSISGTSIAGRIAAAGDVTLDGINVGPAPGEPSPEIIAGRDFIAGRSTGAGGSVSGGVTYGRTADVAPNFTVSGGVTQAVPPFSFESEFVTLRELSASLADEIQTTGASVTLNPYSAALQLTGTDAGLNVFTVSAAQLTRAAGIVIDLTQPGATALINVTTDTELTIAPQYMNLQGSAAASGILWNMPLATGLAVNHGVSWQGSILAPNATVTTSGHPQLSGQLIAATVPSSDLVINETKLTACLPPPSPSEPPAPPDDTLSLTALCIDASGALDMRLRNTGDSARSGDWIDLTGTDFGHFDVPAHSDLFFSVLGGSGTSRIRATSGNTVLQESGTDHTCAGQITVHLIVEGDGPAGVTWPVRITGGANGNDTTVLNLAAGEYDTITVRGGYQPGTAPIDQVVGGVAYTISEDETHGATQVTISLNPVEILEGQNESVTVTNLYTTTESGAGGEGPEQPTLPPGATPPPDGPDLVGEVSGADLSITHRITPARVRVGGVVQSVTVVRNLGPVVANGVVAREIPPFRPHLYDSVSHVLSLTTTAGRCSQGRPVRCQLGALAPGSSVTIRSRTRILVAANLRSVVVVSSNTDDSNTANNMAEAGVTAVGDTPVRAGISAPPFVPFGTRFSYHDTVTDTSPVAALSVRLCTRPPASLLAVQAPEAISYRGLYCLDIPRLAPGQTAGFAVSATPSRSGRLVVSDHATVAGLSRISRASTPVLVGAAAACPSVSRVSREPVAHPAC
ncbi:MAG TPA: collagen-binding domain-containing protein [Solirubrobacteraceae bacterium]